APSGPVFSLEDTSNVTISAMVDAHPINLEASIGPLGVFVTDGVVRLDNGTEGQAATFTIGLADVPGGAHKISDLFSDPAGRVQADVTGQFEVALPVAFPTPDDPQGHVHLTIDDLGDVANTTVLHVDELPDFAAAVSNISIGDLIGLLIDGVDSVLGKLE